MGARPWFYFVPYQPDIKLALEALREREFAAGRYNPVIVQPEFPVTPASACPGPKHVSINAARGAAGESGTRSILDIGDIGTTPDYGIVAPLRRSELIDLYGTEQPTRSMVESNMDFLCGIERGQGAYIVIYSEGHPQEIVFAGLSYD
jgi:hypothetical protein